MATTTPNFGWPVPTSTDLVKDGAVAIEGLGDAIDASLLDLKGGTTGQVLSKASNTDMDFTWVTDAAGDITGVTAGTGISGGGTSGTVTITNSMATAIDAKGDLISGTGADAFARLAVGANGTVLTADSAEATGLKWATAASGGGYTSIASGTLSSAALNITSIPGTYKALVLELRDITKSTAFDVNLQFNADTASSYASVTNRIVNGTTSTIGSVNTTAVVLNGAGFRASTQYNQIIVKMDAYAQTDMWKVCSAYGSGVDTGSNTRQVFNTTGTYISTSAITSIQTDSTMSLKYTLWGLN